MKKIILLSLVSLCLFITARGQHSAVGFLTVVDTIPYDNATYARLYIGPVNEIVFLKEYYMGQKPTLRLYGDDLVPEHVATRLSIIERLKTQDIPKITRKQAIKALAFIVAQQDTFHIYDELFVTVVVPSNAYLPFAKAIQLDLKNEEDYLDVPSYRQEHWMASRQNIVFGESLQAIRSMFETYLELNLKLLENDFAILINYFQMYQVLMHEEGATLDQHKVNTIKTTWGHFQHVKEAYPLLKDENDDPRKLLIRCAGTIDELVGTTAEVKGRKIRKCRNELKAHIDAVTTTDYPFRPVYEKETSETPQEI